MIRPKYRFLFGLLFLALGLLLADHQNLLADSCDGPAKSRGTVSGARFSIKVGQRMLDQGKFSMAAKFLDRVAGFCERSAGRANVAEAASLASYAHERMGDKARAIRYAEQAERILEAIPPGHVDHSRSRPVLKWVKSGLARLRPSGRVREANLLGAPPFNESLFPPSYRTRTRKAARRAPTRRKQASGRTGTVRVVSSPSQAAVVLDGKWKGRTPILLLGLKPGKHRLKVRKKGYREESRILRLAPRARLSLDFRMKRRGRERAEKSKPAPPRREKAPAKRRRLGKISVSRKPAPAKNPPRAPTKKVVVAEGLRTSEEKTGQEVSYRLPGALPQVFEESAPAGGERVIDKIPAIPVKGSARPPVVRVVFVKSVATKSGWPVGKVVPITEVPVFLRKGSMPPEPVFDIPAPKPPEKKSVPKKPRVIKRKPSRRKVIVFDADASRKPAKPVVRRPSIWKARWPQMSMMGLGLLCLAGAFTGWRKRRQFFDEGAESSKIGIRDLDEEDQSETPSETGDIPSDEALDAAPPPDDMDASDALDAEEEPFSGGEVVETPDEAEGEAEAEAEGDDASEGANLAAAEEEDPEAEIGSEEETEPTVQESG